VALHLFRGVERQYRDQTARALYGSVYEFFATTVRRQRLLPTARDRARSFRQIGSSRSAADDRKVYNGREKTFWFSIGSGLGAPRGITLISTAHQPESGDFSQQPRNYLRSFHFRAAIHGTFLRQPFAGNKFPVAHPAARSVLWTP
jgi:hypothetical protein